MIRTTPSLSSKLDEGRNRVGEKYFAGQRLGFAWAGSPIELSSHPCALVLLDEVDRMGADVGGEGDPVALAEARIATYPDGKLVVASSPTLEGASRIWSLWESGSACRWTWPCPHCNTYFTPEFKLLTWPEKSTPPQAKKAARLGCPHCGGLIEDRQKTEMNARGCYETTGDPESDTASFWVSGLCSPWRTFGDAARGWLEAHRSGEPGEMQATINTVFGELFRVKGEAPPAAAVEKLRGAYHFDEVPAAVRVLTCGVDVQGDRLVYVIRGWAEAQTSWLIRHGELYGDTSLEHPWADLATLLESRFGKLRVLRTFVDSGYRPDSVYRFARRINGVLPSKGHDHAEKPVYLSKLDVNFRGQPQKYGVHLAHIDTGYFKSWIHGRITWPLDQPGAWHLPSDATDDYCNQIVSEQRITKPNGAVRWIRTKSANHFLDAEVLAAAAAHLLQVHLLSKRAPAKNPDPDAPPSQAPAAPQRKTGLNAPRRPPNWVTNWR